MASEIFNRLRERHFSENFLRSKLGTYSEVRRASCEQRNIWKRCKACNYFYVIVSELIGQVLSSGPNIGTEKNPAANLKTVSVKKYWLLGLCSRKCALSQYGERDHVLLKGIEFAKRKDFYSTKEWKRLRYDVLAKHKGVCMLCGASAKTGAVIHIDHIKPKFSHPELSLDETNLQVLCEECNLGKGMRDDTDFR